MFVSMDTMSELDKQGFILPGSVAPAEKVEQDCQVGITADPCSHSQTLYHSLLLACQPGAHRRLAVCT